MSTQWTARRVKLTLLFLVVVAAIGVLGVWAASPFVGVPNAIYVGDATAVTACLILVLVPVRISVAVSEVFPGRAEPLFQLATDPTLSLQVSGNPRRRRLVRQTGEAGQPGSSWVTEGEGLVLTTTVVSSDPPRKLVTTMTTQRRLQRVEMARTYRPVLEGTLLEIRARQRMPLFSWLLRRSLKRTLAAEVAQMNARIRDYLESVAANETGAGN